MAADSTDKSAGEATVLLLERVRAGDTVALNVLIQRYLDPLRRWASGRLPRSARDLRDTDDLVQDTLIGTLRNLDTFEAKQHGALHAYLRQSICNRIRDEVRRRARTPDAVELQDEEFAALGPSPLEEVIGREALERYERAMERLSAADRDAVIARVELGLNHREAAAALGKSSPDAARVAISRALLKLAEEMGRE